MAKFLKKFMKEKLIVEKSLTTYQNEKLMKLKLKCLKQKKDWNDFIKMYVGESREYRQDWFEQNYNNDVLEHMFFMDLNYIYLRLIDAIIWFYRHDETYLLLKEDKTIYAMCNRDDEEVNLMPVYRKEKQFGYIPYIRINDFKTCEHIESKNLDELIEICDSL